MNFILTPQQMKNVDEFAIKTLHIPSLRLMEKAGEAVVNETITRIRAVKYPNTKRVSSAGVITAIVLCGKGNNGGDGFVIARLLAKKKYAVTVVLIERDKSLSSEALMQYKRICAGDITGIDIVSAEKYLHRKGKKADVIIDAMLGISFQGELKGKYLKAVEWCNKQTALKIAVDIPTGLNGETGEVLSEAFCADATVTMSNPKPGFYCGRAKEYTGEVIVADIGIPSRAIRKTKRMLVEKSDVQKIFPRRASNSHKHSVGKIFVLAGSKSMMGAAWLCSQSAMRSGAGQVILGIPETEYPVIAKRSIEVMPLGLPSTPEGSISSDAKGEIGKRISWSTVVLIGCGMSRTAETQEVIREVIRTCSRTLVIDADGLNALIGHREILKKRKAKHVILTPHMGEFSRLTGLPADEIEKNRYSIASDFAAEYNVTLILKGAPSIIADNKGNIFVNPTGNPGMSTAGSGDVLAGIVAAFVGQGNSTVDASVNGVYLHGRAGDIAAEKIGQHGMITSDIIKYLPTAIREVVK